MSDMSGAPAPPTVGAPGPVPSEAGAPPPEPPPAPVEAPAEPGGLPVAPTMPAPAQAPPATATGLPADEVERAIALHRSLHDPTAQSEAMTRLVRQFGQLPEWFTWDHALDAMRGYAEFVQENEASPEVATEAPGVPGTGFSQAEVEQMMQRYTAPLQTEIQNLQAARAQEENDRRASLVQGAVESIARNNGLQPVQAETLLRNVVYGLREAIDAGHAIDFRSDALASYADGMLTHLRALSMVEQNARIEDHRRVAPAQFAPTGPATGPAVPTGMAGAAARALEIARAMEGRT